jgi:hypothetical protein
VVHFAIFGGPSITLPHGWSRVTVAVMLGGAEIDASAPPSGEGMIRIVTLFGGAEVRVSRDARVAVGGFSLLGGRTSNVGPGEPEGPSIKVTGVSIFGGIEVRQA